MVQSSVLRLRLLHCSPWSGACPTSWPDPFPPLSPEQCPSRFCHPFSPLKSHILFACPTPPACPNLSLAPHPAGSFCVCTCHSLARGHLQMRKSIVTMSILGALTHQCLIYSLRPHSKGVTYYCSPFVSVFSRRRLGPRGRSEGGELALLRESMPK